MSETLTDALDNTLGVISGAGSCMPLGCIDEDLREGFGRVLNETV